MQQGTKQGHKTPIRRFSLGLEDFSRSRDKLFSRSVEFLPIRGEFQISILYNVCSVHWGMFSTSGGAQYIGGYNEYIGGCSVHREDIMMYVGDITLRRSVSCKALKTNGRIYHEKIKVVTVTFRIFTV